jgi:glucokinase
MSRKQWVIGIDLGGTKIGTGIVDLEGRVHERDYQPTQAQEGAEEGIRRMTSTARRLMARAGIESQDVLSIGVGAPGPLDIPKGLLIDPPNLPSWCDVPLGQAIEREMQIPTYLENDANAAAIGEYLYGAGRGTRNMLYVTVSTGIGGGLILNGRIYHGARGGAGEVGHTTLLPDGPLCSCGNRGCLEALASGTAVAREGRELVRRGIATLIQGAEESISARDVVEAMRGGDPYAASIVDRAMHHLGIGMANLVNLFNPEMIVIGGGLSNLGEDLLAPVRRGIAVHAFPAAARQVRVTLAELGNEVGIVGAAGAAIMLSRETQTSRTS